MIVLNMFIQCVDAVGEEEGEPRREGRRARGPRRRAKRPHPPPQIIQRRLGSE